MSEGSFLRLNSAMLNSVEPLQMFSIVGTIESCDGTTLVVKSVDMGQVFFNVDPGFVMPVPVRLKNIYFVSLYALFYALLFAYLIHSCCV